MIKKYWLYAVLILLLVTQSAASAYFWQRTLANERVNQDIMKAAVEASKQKQPVNVTVTAPGTTQPINLKVEMIQPTAPGEKPKVSVTAEKVLCRTEEECRKIYGQAEQSITVNAELKKSTVVPVCLVQFKNECPPDQIANLPLARGFGLKIDLVRLTGGAFAALEPVYGNLTITTVVTVTAPLEIKAPEVHLPYNLGFPAIRAIIPVNISQTMIFAGATYQNYLSPNGGVYEIGAGMSFGGWAAFLGYTVPIR